MVLRHYCDLSEAETAALLGISVGTVKSRTSRGLARLRVIVEPARPEGQMSLEELEDTPGEDLRRRRRAKFRGMGVYA